MLKISTASLAVCSACISRITVGAVHLTNSSDSSYQYLTLICRGGKKWNRNLRASFSKLIRKAYK